MQACFLQKFEMFFWVGFLLIGILCNFVMRLDSWVKWGLFYNSQSTRVCVFQNFLIKNSSFKTVRSGRVEMLKSMIELDPLFSCS